MGNDETLQWVTLLVTALGTIFMGLSALKEAEPVTAEVCPNCGQPFDTTEFPVVAGRKLVTCPRCRYTYEV